MSEETEAKLSIWTEKGEKSENNTLLSKFDVSKR